MNPKIYFIQVNQSESQHIIKSKFSQLIEQSGCLEILKVGDWVVIKIHFGEEKNTGYVKPEYIKVLVDKIKEKGAGLCLSDTNTLYSGRRTNSKDHTELAYEHGFTEDIAGAEVIIPDDTKAGNVSKVSINQKYVKEAKIAGIYNDSDVIVGVAHFKGHMMTGFGGALKNIGMGCAAREGKLEQHSGLSPFVIKRKCINCGSCVKICASSAIGIIDEKAFISSGKCTGCAICIAVCPKEAIDVKWASGADTIQEKMIEYAKAVLDKKKDKSIFINFLTKITKECDCMAKDDPRIVPDIGILISKDPVAIDKASLDLVVNACRRDIFREVHPERNGDKQLRYAHKLGLGSLEYDLSKIQ